MRVVNKVLRDLVYRTPGDVLIGYARVGNDERSLATQVEALRTAGCEQIYEDRAVDGDMSVKPQFLAALNASTAGDEIVVAQLDRVAQSFGGLIEAMRSLEDRGVAFRSIREGIETVTPAGRSFFHTIGALATFESDIEAQALEDGQAAPSNGGKRIGRPPRITPERWEEALSLLQGDPPTPVAAVAERLGVTRQAIYKRLKDEGVGS